MTITTRRIAVLVLVALIVAGVAALAEGFLVPFPVWMGKELSEPGFTGLRNAPLVRQDTFSRCVLGMLAGKL
jgi:hypothetical protein